MRWRKRTMQIRSVPPIAEGWARQGDTFAMTVSRTHTRGPRDVLCYPDGTWPLRPPGDEPVTWVDYPWVGRVRERVRVD